MEPSTLVKACSWRLWVGLKIQVTGCVFLIPHISITKMVAPCGVYVLTRVLFLIVSLTHCHVSEMVKNLPAVQEAKVQSLGREGPLERGMATNSRTLAWIIPWTGEPGRLQSIVSHRVSHDWSNLVCTHALVVEFDSSHFQEREARNRNPFGIFREQFPLTAGHREKLWFPNQFSTAKKNLCPPANRWAPSDNSTGASQVAQC